MKFFFAVLSVLIIAGCEQRVFLNKLPDIDYKDGRYVFYSAGREYDKVLLKKDSSNTELASCRETESELGIFSCDDAGYYDLYLITGTDTVLANNTYIGTYEQGSFKITALDVAQGDCFIIHPPDGLPSVIDGGFGSSGWEDWHGGGENRLADHLIAGGFTQLKYIIETHSDLDHSGGLKDVVEDERFSRQEYLTHDSDLPAPGDTLFFSPTVKGVMLHYYSTADTSDVEENDRSVCIKLIYHDLEMIFTGDISQQIEISLIDDQLIDPYEQYEILKIAHHGSGYSSSQEFLNAVDPLYSLICVGEGNPYHHPSEETIERIKKTDSGVLRTDINRTVNIFSDGTSFQISYFE
ncbi:MAG: MBL fold metallo-hydrolase [Candidatus Delongbacteria bacterium]